MVAMEQYKRAYYFFNFERWCAFSMSVELQKAVDSYENYIQQHGVDEAVVNAMVEASKVAILTEKDTE